MGELFIPIIWAVEQIVWLFVIVLVVRILMSWMIAFQVINQRHPAVWQVNRAVIAVTDPVMRPIRRIIPPMGGVDLSPLVLLIAASVIQMYLEQLKRALL